MTIQIAQRIGAALGVASATRIKELDTCLREYVRSVSPAGATPVLGSIDASQVVSGQFANPRISEASVTQHQLAFTLAASQINSGTFADARIAQSNVTQHQAALAILETQITDGALLARMAANESVSGQWSFTTGRLDNGNARLTWRVANVADDTTEVYSIAGHGLVVVIGAAGGSVTRDALFWVASSGQTTGAINTGANFSLGTTVNPDVDGNINAWMSAANQLSVKNRHGSARDIFVASFGTV